MDPQTFLKLSKITILTSYGLKSIMLGLCSNTSNILANSFEHLGSQRVAAATPAITISDIDYSVPI